GPPCRELPVSAATPSPSRCSPGEHQGRRQKHRTHRSGDGSPVPTAGTGPSRSQLCAPPWSSFSHTESQSSKATAPLPIGTSAGLSPLTWGSGHGLGTVSPRRPASTLSR
ncbi:unnamed protein product, partial [Rangifer tarandus platyrhynchus]